ncbi:MAG: RidA family protein [Gammaproteobacteria bacterium]|nr:enamine deaminase RidA [Gammaproteobacteria bacterium]
METIPINPWTWQERLNFSHAVDVRGAERLVFIAGQTSVGPDGRALHVGDMAGQLGRAFDNLETVLSQAGLTLANVVRLNYYVTDMAAFEAARHVVDARLGPLPVKPPGVLLGVACLAHPDLLVEIEATAAAG